MTLFTTAQRTQAKLRLAIDGPSGSGKTYSALLIAKGLAGGDLSKVALIDTERGSGSLYADLGAYAVADMHPPYSVDKYIKALAAAADEGFEVIVVDSMTHAWSGEGGVLDYVDAVAKAQTRGNSFAAWKEGTPLQQRLIDTILASPCHVIVTMRSKTEWVLEENEKGKKQPRKIGLAPDQRKDVDYEFTLVLDLSREHIATASKDRTGLFDSRLEVPTEAMGAELAEWLGSAAPEPPSRQTIRDEQSERAPAVAGSSEPAQSGESVNGHISQAQARGLHEMLVAKGKESRWFLSVCAGSGVGDGEHLTSLPAAEYDNLVAIIRTFPDPAPIQPAQKDEPALSASAFEAVSAEPQEPASEQQAAQAATRPQAEETAPESPDEEPPGMDAEAFKAKRASDAAAAAPKSRKKGTVTAQQLTRLGALCADLEKQGVGRDEWRLMMHEKEGVVSRTELSKAAATRMIDYLVRWVTDVTSGVESPGEKVA